MTYRALFTEVLAERGVSQDDIKSIINEGLFAMPMPIDDEIKGDAGEFKEAVKSLFNRLDKDVAFRNYAASHVLNKLEADRATN